MEVVDLAIEGNAVLAVAGRHRLVGPRIQVLNGEAPVAQHHTLARPHPLRVGAAQAHSIRHAPNGINRRACNRLIRRDESRDSAHARTTPGKSSTSTS